MKKSLLIGTLFLKVLFDIFILIILIVLISYAISSIASLAIFEDISYIKLMNFIEKSFVDCIYNKICEERIWMEEFYYNPIKYDFYFNFSDGRIYLIKCEEIEGKMYFSVSDKDLYRVFSQNCRVLKRTRPILNSSTTIIIENNGKNISVYTLKIETERKKYYFMYESNIYDLEKVYIFNGRIGDFKDICSIKIKDINNKFEINNSTVRKSLGSFLFGESSKVWINRTIKEFNLDVCNNEIQELDPKSDLVEKGLLMAIPFNVFINSSKREIRFIIPKT
ncbi:MAG: hypothetical protein QW184_00120 [Nanopusillaceae archaeon]